MPLIVSELPKIKDLSALLGKKIVDESLVPIEENVNYPIENVVFKSQLPSTVVLIKQDIEKTAIVGAFKSGLVPLVIDKEGIVVRVY